MPHEISGRARFSITVEDPDADWRGRLSEEHIDFSSAEVDSEEDMDDYEYGDDGDEP
jgi:hypothetical protein